MLVASVPDLYRLWQVAHTNKVAQLVWSAGFCRTMLDRPTSTSAADAARRHAGAHPGHQPTTASSPAPARRTRSCRFDDNAVFNYPFAISDLSPFDYFHPNAAGQQTLVLHHLDQERASDRPVRPKRVLLALRRSA